MMPASNLELYTTAARPSGQRAGYRGALMGCGERIDEILRVAEVGHGHAACAIDHHRPSRDPDARTPGEQPGSFDGLCHGEIGRRATGIERGAVKVILHMHAAKVHFHSHNKMTMLEVVANLAAAAETTRAQRLVAYLLLSRGRLIKRNSRSD